MNQFIDIDQTVTFESYHHVEAHLYPSGNNIGTRELTN